MTYNNAHLYDSFAHKYRVANVNKTTILYSISLEHETMYFAKNLKAMFDSIFLQLRP